MAVNLSGWPTFVLLADITLNRTETTRHFNRCLSLFLSAASIAIRRLIGVTEVKKTGSSYGDQEAKKQN